MYAEQFPEGVIRADPGQGAVLPDIAQVHCHARRRRGDNPLGLEDPQRLLELIPGQVHRQADMPDPRLIAHGLCQHRFLLHRRLWRLVVRVPLRGWPDDEGLRLPPGARQREDLRGPFRQPRERDHMEAGGRDAVIGEDLRRDVRERLVAV